MKRPFNSLLTVRAQTDKNLRYVAVEGMCTMIVDLNPRYWQKTKLRRPLLVAGACLFCFFAALPMVTKGGMYVFQVILLVLKPSQTLTLKIKNIPEAQNQVVISLF